MEYTFTAAALVRIGEILDAWPCPDRGTMKALDAIAAKIELSDEMSDEDKLAISWRPVGAGQFRYDDRAELTRELTVEDAATLLQMVEQPPQKLAWTRSDKAMQAAVFEPLGGTPWL